MAGTVRLHGYRELLRACDRAGKETKREVRAAFREVGDIVKVDARTKLQHYSPKSARGLRTRVRARGVAVEQSLRRTTGKRRDWGATQMSRSLEPALQENVSTVNRKMEDTVDRITNHFAR